MPVLVFELRSMLRRRTYQVMTAAFPVLGVAVLLVIRLVTAASEPDEPALSALARIFTLVPFTSPLTVMLRFSAASPAWLDITGGAVVLALSTLGVLFLSARVFRAYLLLYGRRPGLRELWRTLRTAG